MGSVPDDSGSLQLSKNCDKVSHMNFWCPSAYKKKKFKSYLHTIVWSVKCVVVTK